MSSGDNQRDGRFDSFKAWSGRLERRSSYLRGRPQEPEVEASDSDIVKDEPVPAADRYFDALQGPELDTLRASVLPEDETWPFLLRFPISLEGSLPSPPSLPRLSKFMATLRSSQT
ncbi:unnamed protein product [Musa banksii]